MLIVKSKGSAQDNGLLDGLQSAFRLIDEIQSSNDNEVVIDFEDCFVSPFFVLLLILFTKSCQKKIEYKNLSSYMKTIMFRDGMKPDEMRKSEFIANMEIYASKSYIPIVNFPATTKNDDDKNAILSTVESIIEKQLNLDKNIVSGLKYLIGEIVDNITEHSDSERAYIFAQTYSHKKYIDICIADSGITILGQYKKTQNKDITTDIDAIQAANAGVSTKNLPRAENRGYGIITSKKMLVDGLGGHFVMMSGDAVHIKNRDVNKYAVVPDNMRCNGTIIALRIPYDNKCFQYVRYIE